METTTKRPVGRPKMPDSQRVQSNNLMVHLDDKRIKYVRTLAEKSRRTIRATVEDLIDFHRSGGRK